MKRLVKKIVISLFVLIGLNYFFAHLAFNQVLNKFVKTTLVKDSSISFSSYFSFLPKAIVHINNLDYKDKDKQKLQISSFNTNIDLSTLITKHQLKILDLKFDSMILRLKAKHIDILLKKIVFRLIREGLGVLSNTNKVQPIKSFSINKLQLERLQDNNAEIFNIINVLYDSNRSNYMNFCFNSSVDAQKFYQRFIAQYLIAAKVKGDCISFSKVGKR